MNLRRALVLTVLAGAAAVFAPACAAPEPNDERVSERSAAIAASDVMARAQQWVDAKLLYCQAPNHAHDDDSACPSTCTREDNSDWDAYRSDCSGFVSWAWGLKAPGHTTSTFAPFQTDVSDVISAADLQPGDAVNKDGHIMLFKAWVTVGSVATFQEEPGCSASPNYAHEFTSPLSVQADGTVYVTKKSEAFYPIRFNDIQQDLPTGPTGDDSSAGGSSSAGDDSSGEGDDTAAGGSPAAGDEWAAAYVNQSWPLSEKAPIQLVVGKLATGSIDMKNKGTATWPAGVVMLAPTPRDQASDMAAPTWVSPTRVSTLTADVPPGQVGHFEWDLQPAEAGDFQPYFSLVADGAADGTTWFADSGGPPDNVIQVNVHVDPAPAGDDSGDDSSVGGAPASGGSAGAAQAAGAPAQKGGAASTSGGAPAQGSAGKTATAGGSIGAGAPTAAGDDASTGDDSTSGENTHGLTGGGSSAKGTGGARTEIIDTGSSESNSGCAMSPSGDGAGDRDGFGFALLGAFAIAARRRPRLTRS